MDDLRWFLIFVEFGWISHLVYITLYVFLIWWCFQMDDTDAPGVTWKNHLPTSLHFMESRGVTWPWKWHPKDSLQRRTFSNKIEKKNPPFELHKFARTFVQLLQLKFNSEIWKKQQRKNPSNKIAFSHGFFCGFWSMDAKAKLARSLLQEEPRWAPCRSGFAQDVAWSNRFEKPEVETEPKPMAGNPWVFRRSLRAARKAGKLTFLGKTVWLFFWGGWGWSV